MTGADLKTFALLADLSDGERDELAARLEQRPLLPGETLFQEGEEADALVLIAEGTLELSSRRAAEKPAQGAQRQALQSVSMGPGSALGALALFQVGSREATASVALRAEVWLLRREDFLRFADDNPRAAWRVAAGVAAEVASQLRLALGTLAASVDPEGAAE